MNITVGKRNEPLYALLRANLKAAELRRKALGYDDGPWTILHGAPTHSAAFLLTALQEDGWTIAPVDGSAA